MNLAELTRTVRLCQISKTEKEKKEAVMQSLMELGYEKFLKYAEN